MRYIPMRSCCAKVPFLRLGNKNVECDIFWINQWGNQARYLKILFLLISKYKICWQILLTMKYLSWNTFIKAAAQHCNVLCKSGHILQCSFEDNFNVILCKRYTCMRTQQLIIHRMKASTTTTILYCLEYDEADSHEGRAMPAWMLVSIFIHCYTSSRNVMPLRLLSRTFLWRM